MNTWTGILWIASHDTVDGRRIMPEALRLMDRPAEAGPVPLRMRAVFGALNSFGEYEYVGQVDQMIERNGIGFGIGKTNCLDPGIYRVAVDLCDVISELDGDCFVVTAGTLGAVTIMAPDQPSAWPECEILVHRA